MVFREGVRERSASIEPPKRKYIAPIIEVLITPITRTLISTLCARPTSACARLSATKRKAVLDNPCENTVQNRTTLKAKKSTPKSWGESKRPSKALVASPVKASAVLPPSAQALPKSTLRFNSEPSGSPSPLRLTVGTPYGSERWRGQDLI